MNTSGHSKTNLKRSQAGMVEMKVLTLTDKRKQMDWEIAKRAVEREYIYRVPIVIWDPNVKDTIFHG